MAGSYEWRRLFLKQRPRFSTGERGGLTAMLSTYSRHDAVCHEPPRHSDPRTGEIAGPYCPSLRRLE